MNTRGIATARAAAIGVWRASTQLVCSSITNCLVIISIKRAAIFGYRRDRRRNGSCISRKNKTSGAATATTHDIAISGDYHGSVMATAKNDAGGGIKHHQHLGTASAACRGIIDMGEWRASS